MCGLFFCFRLLRTQSLDWYYNNVKSRFKCFGSAKVLKNLYKKHRLESGLCPDAIGKNNWFDFLKDLSLSALTQKLRQWKS